jgi:hypothetical protein
MTQTRHTDWDASTPQVITNAHGRPIGVLQPRIAARVLNASAGIQPHSVPGRANRVTLYGGDGSVAHFAHYWEKHTGRTYPFSTRS